ncbi:hypothetical protein [Candidatus Methanocrinis alkalitolerans]|jgi:hypothetical protein|nr:hypothetical protein [Candidatus Methanocrinis alkalitolerans]
MRKKIAEISSHELSHDEGEAAGCGEPSSPGREVRTAALRPTRRWKRG